MKKVLGIGNALVDVITMMEDDSILDKFSLPKGSMQLVDNEKSQLIKGGTRDLKRNMASGGSAANTIHGFAMLGAQAGFIGSIGKDETGDVFENDMKKAGVKTMLARRDEITGTSVSLISPDSERTMATHLGAAAQLVASDLNSSSFEGFDILYAEGYLIINRDLIETSFRLAKQNNMKIAMDLASYNVVESFRSDFRELIEKYVDIVFANEEEAKSFTGLAPSEALDSISQLCEIAVVKTGKNGSMIQRGEEIIRVGTIDVKSLDTTGAGDLYASGFLYGYSCQYDLEKCGLFGSILAGNVIEVIGTKMDEKRWQGIKEMIDKVIEE